MPKERLTVTVDPELLAAANEAVAAGRVASVSQWVSEALARESERARLLAGGEAAIKEYEAEFGVITEEEAEEAYRAAKARAIVIRPER